MAYAKRPVKKHNPHAFTIECGRSGPIKTVGFSETVPDTVVSTSRHAKSTSSLSDSDTITTDTLLGAMEKIMKKPMKTRKSGVETSILTAIAEGEDELATAYSKLSIDPKTGTKRLTKDIVEAVSIRSKIDVKKLALMISRAQRVSLCFLVDTTGSMGPYISGVKDQIIEMVNQIEASGCEIVGLAFVGYKDWCDGVNHFEILTFTTDIESFKSFVTKIYAVGGGDTPEDVVGAIDQAVSIEWPRSSGTRVLFHLGDAPPHGRPKYHSYDDEYPEGHSRDKPLEILFSEMLNKNIKYFFGRINNYCDTMIEVFEKYYGKKIDSFASETVSTISRSVTTAVTSSVVASSNASISACRLGHLKHRKYTLDETEPNWSSLPYLEGTILSFKLPESIEVITSFAKLEEEIFRCKLQVAPNPFAKGSVRLAFYGKILGKREDNVVFKEIISVSTVEELDRQRYMTDLEVQSVAAKLAFEFNGRLCRTKANPNIRLKFLMAKVVRISLPDGNIRFMAHEKRFHGAAAKMIKYTNNLNFVLNVETLDADGQVRLKMAVAFSHFSYDVTDGYLLVCDLQGISTVDSKGKATLLLTDPAIHCSTHYRFGKTNLQEVGIKQFFENHVCNEFCNALKLVVPKF